MKTYISQGEQAIGRRGEDMIQTILGSCVAVCLWDPQRKMGGMNHILLPHRASSDLGALGAGATAMERLINALMRGGAEKARLEAKVFGGASIVEGLSDIGAQNTRFVMEYLAAEGIPCVAESTGGRMARQIRFWPATGRVSQRFVQPDRAPDVKLDEKPTTSDLELL